MKNNKYHLKNPNCENIHCIDPHSEVRILPTSGQSNILLCHSCYLYEIHWRKQRNTELGMDFQFKLPNWENLKVYPSL
jgi:hypothetical protein